MKKLVTMVLVSLLAFALTGCAGGGALTAQAYASKDSRIERVSILVSDRAVEIAASHDNQVYIDYYDSESEHLDVAVSESGELTVKLERQDKWTNFFGMKPSKRYRKILIKLPTNLIRSVTAQTTNGDIHLQPLAITERVELRTNGGNIVCERIEVGKEMQLSAKNGSITGSVKGGWDDFAISCQIKKGECNLPLRKESGTKTLVADCNNGDIDIEFVV